MNGSDFFFAFALVSFPAACVALVALRRQVLLWLWLERQWRARQAMVAARSKGKAKARPGQILLFPELAHRGDAEGAEPAVNDWSVVPAKEVRS